MDQYHQYELFRDVQESQVFADGKTFVDCTPLSSWAEINDEYLSGKNDAGFSLERFVRAHFEIPVTLQQEYILKAGSSVTEHIEALWDLLIRPAIPAEDPVKLPPSVAKGSKLALPFTYVVPGGRFREMYYWDTYFTMLGLQVSGRKDVLEGIIKNFSYLIDTIGYIPNGTRDYFIGRSQPPFYSLMLELVAMEMGNEILATYLPQLEKEYAFWMKGVATLTPTLNYSAHVVRMKGGELLNRYKDEHDSPRPESYREDVELARHNLTGNEDLFAHLRAGAESGWDFSSRWFAEASSFDTIHTTDLVPVDLNCLIWNLEKVISKAQGIAGNVQEQARYQLLADNRKAAINRYLWDESREFYFDYDFTALANTDHYTVAAATPLFFGLASELQAQQVAYTLEERFLVAGGLLTTLNVTGQQWDAPNGWAPLQWIAITGLRNYGHHQLAAAVAERWIRLNRDVFNRTGKLMEKYNVVDPTLPAGGGEYEGQDGFGWTNGVLVKLMQMYGDVMPTTVAGA